jgi:hypothetical protein
MMKRCEVNNICDNLLLVAFMMKLNEVAIQAENGKAPNRERRGSNLWKPF